MTPAPPPEPTAPSSSSRSMTPSPDTESTTVRLRLQWQAPGHHLLPWMPTNGANDSVASRYGFAPMELLPSIPWSRRLGLQLTPPVAASESDEPRPPKYCNCRPCPGPWCEDQCDDAHNAVDRGGGGELAGAAKAMERQLKGMRLPSWTICCIIFVAILCPSNYNNLNIEFQYLQPVGCNFVP
jgi:hypothetical protein